MINDGIPESPKGKQANHENANRYSSINHTYDYENHLHMNELLLSDKVLKNCFKKGEKPHTQEILYTSKQEKLRVRSYDNFFMEDKYQEISELKEGMNNLNSDNEAYNKIISNKYDERLNLINSLQKFNNNILDKIEQESNLGR